MTYPVKAATKQKHYPWVRDWESPYSENAGQLHGLGETEMQQLGARYAKMVPGLFGKAYNPADFKFISSQAGTPDLAQRLWHCRGDTCTKWRLSERLHWNDLKYSKSIGNYKDVHP